MSEALIFTAKLRGSVYFSPALQLHFMCVELKATVLVWRCKLLGLGNYGRVLFVKTSNLATVHLTQWEMLFGSWRELQAGRTSWNLLEPNGHGLTGIMPAPEQPCSPASSHGKLSFRPVIVTTAHAHAVKPFVTVLSLDEAAIYSLNSTDCG